MDMINHYMDVTVLMTNLYNHCDINYILQKIGKAVVSLSGFMDLLTNFLFRFFSSDDSQLYIDLSTAIDAGDTTTIGLKFGTFIKIFLVTEIPAVVDELETIRYVTARVD